MPWLDQSVILALMMIPPLLCISAKLKWPQEAKAGA
jgi:hypothetical protein